MSQQVSQRVKARSLKLWTHLKGVQSRIDPRPGRVVLVQRYLVSPLADGEALLVGVTLEVELQLALGGIDHEPPSAPRINRIM